MYKVLYNSLKIYFNALSKLGHVSYDQVEKLIVLDFITNLIYRDYRGNIKRKDYSVFERALSNLYGRTCLIPFTDYNKMSKLHIGELGEILDKINKASKHIDEVENHLDINDTVTVAFAGRIAVMEQEVEDLNERVNDVERVNEEQGELLENHSDRILQNEQDIDSIKTDIGNMKDSATRLGNRVTATENRLDEDEPKITENGEAIKVNRQRIEILEDIHKQS